MAKQLGATVEAALTITVTHVVAIGFNSPKYHVSRSTLRGDKLTLQYAVKNRLPVLTPDWIETAHAKWLNGAELTVRETMDGKELLAFTGLTIAMSGIDPSTFLLIHPCTY